MAGRLARLIDGHPGDSGARIVRRSSMLVIPLTIISNTVGAVTMFVLAVFVIPVAEPVNALEIVGVNAVVLVVYLVVALLVGTRWAWPRYRGATAWLRDDRVPTEAEQHVVLREPVRYMSIHAVMWLTGSALFAMLNLRYSGGLALTVAVTGVIGGLLSCAFAFLAVTRIMRPIIARALAGGVPRRPVQPGVTTRAVLAWTLGTAGPLVGLMLIAVGEVTGMEDVTDNEIAIAILGLGGGTLLVGIAVVFLSARSAAAPVLDVRDAMKRVEDGDLRAEVAVFDDSELGLLQAGFNRMAAGLREREQLRDLFGRQVGEDVARQALAGRVELGGELREVAVLFVDVIGSTTLAATRPAHEVVELLNGFFDVVVDVVTRHGGWINKFEGDAALAVFGVPVDRGDFAAGALAAGRELAARLPVEVDDLEAAIGISAGLAVAGNIGAERRYEYTVIGDPVNEAARLTELAKATDCRVLASATALARATNGEAANWRLGDTVHLRGRTEPTRIAKPA